MIIGEYIQSTPLLDVPDFPLIWMSVMPPTPVPKHLRKSAPNKPAKNRTHEELKKLVKTAQNGHIPVRPKLLPKHKELQLLSSSKEDLRDYASVDTTDQLLTTNGLPPHMDLSLKSNVDAQRESALKWVRNKSKSQRDIAPVPIAQINWKRRLLCKSSLRLFCENYLPNVFFKSWSKDQLICVERAEEVILRGGKFALAMPRGGGKTAICRAATLWATAYGHRRCLYNIGATQPKSLQTLDFIKMYWYRSRLLQADFPEIGYPVDRLENRFHLANGQTYNGLPTHTIWGGDSIRLPSLLLPKEVADRYLDKDPSSMIFLEEEGLYYPTNAAITLTTSGIGGSIRGEADVNPITLEQPRPDLVILDDVQKDEVADSPTSCEKLIRRIDGAITGLAGPGEQIAALMPCTVIREGDVADTYLDPLLKPDWNGQRCRLVIQWPEGINDFEIRQDTDAGASWNRYAELRRKSLLQNKDISLATQHYADNREAMDKGFIVSWEERYTTKGKNPELSAQQHAMELRLTTPNTFPAEYQNIGRKLVEEGEMTITADQLMQKTLGYKRRELPPDTQVITAFIDPQNEGFFYQIFATDLNFTGIFTDWGVYPGVTTNYYTKEQLNSWSLLSNAFFKEYPHYREEASVTTHGHIRAPLEAKIYFGLENIVAFLESLVFTRRDASKKQMKIQKIGIDTRWGAASDVIKRFIRETNKSNLIVPYQGQAFSPDNKQLEEYELRDGWLFEHQLHPEVKEPAWCLRPNTSDGSFYMQCDVSRQKDFLFQRLSSPKGTEGSISLPQCSPEELELICNHICSSEFPEKVFSEKKGKEKNIWRVRETGIWDNDFLDCSVGNITLASYCGCSLKTTESQPVPIKRKFSEERKKRKRS